MAVIDKTMDTAGGAVTGAAKGGVAGFLAPIVAGAVIGGLAIMAAVATGGAIFGAGAAAAAFSGLGLGAAAIGATVGGIGSGTILSLPTAALGAIGGGIVGGAKGFRGNSPEQAQDIDQALVAERARTNALSSQLAARQTAASSNDNPDAANNWVAKTQTPPVQQQSTMPAMNDAVDSSTAPAADKPTFVSKTQTVNITPSSPQRA